MDDAHRLPLKPLYDGQFRVLEAGPKSFVLDLGGREERVTVDRLKPAHVVADEVVCPAQVPRRGRPPSRFAGRPSQVESLNSEPASGDGSAVRACERAGKQQQVPPAVSGDGRRNRFGRTIRPPVRFTVS